MSEVVGLGVQEPANTNGAFPRLEDSQRERLRAAGRAEAGASRRDPVPRGRRRLRLLRRRIRRGRDRARLWRREPVDRGPRPPPLPRRAQPADRRAGVSDRRRPRPGGGDPGSAPAAARAAARRRGAGQHRVRCLHVAPHDPDRARGGRPPDRVSLLRGQPPAARVPGAQPDAVSVDGPRVRRRGRGGPAGAVDHARARRRS